ncbi:MAG: iron uptake porin [Almyronema sp.]
MRIAFSKLVLVAIALLSGLRASAAIAGAEPGVVPAAIAQTAPDEQQPSDISPTHWAYTAVQRLVTEYGCMTGYPDGTFRGDQRLTRYEFAAAMNACLETLVQLIEMNEAASDTAEVLATQQNLQQQLFCLDENVTTLEEADELATSTCVD